MIKGRRYPEEVVQKCDTLGLELSGGLEYHLACQGHSQNGIDRGCAKKIGANKCHCIYLLGNPIEDIFLVYHGSL